MWTRPSEKTENFLRLLKLPKVYPPKVDRGCEMNGKLFISAAVVLLVAIVVTANASAQNTYLFHRHYWHGIPDVDGVGDNPDATASDGRLTAIWTGYYHYPDSIWVWLTEIGDEGYIENEKAMEVNQSTLKGDIEKIAKTSWGYVVIAGDHLVGLDNNFNVLWCKEPKNHFNGGAVIVSDGDKVVIGESDNWGLPYSYVYHGVTFMSVDQSGDVTKKTTLWWSGEGPGCSDMIRDSSGNYVALGTRGDYAADSGIIKLDSNLHPQWAIHGFGGMPGIWKYRIGHIVENSNGVYIAAGEVGWGWEGYMRKPWIVAIDKDGNVLWAKTYDSLEGLGFGDVISTQDGGLLFLLGAWDIFCGDVPVLLKTDADGNPQWCKQYKNGMQAWKIIPADDGYYVLGRDYGNVGDVFDINRSEELWYGSIFKVDLEGNIPSDVYGVEEWQVDPPQIWNNLTYTDCDISYASPEEWDPTFVDSDMPVALQNEPKVATVFEYAPNKPPVANFTYSPENPVVGQAVTFDASESYDPEGSIVSYEWDFGDGTTASGMVVTHAYSAAGSYTVTLTVTDDAGAKNSTSRLITVLPPPPPPTPAVSVSTDKYEYAAGDTMLINLTLANPTDEWRRVRFLWRLDLPDYGLRLPIINNISLWLPPGYEKTFTLRWRLPRWRLSFKASWYVALFDAKTSELISEDRADWEYTAKTKRITPEEVMGEV
ncbi:MAG: PKD repeat domain protein [Candidatus Alkanophagales archaeon MCA70_species_2]|nr:PKD repeat domain protein [Candidatus Alkanophaga liquidiphilum]